MDASINVSSRWSILTQLMTNPVATTNKLWLVHCDLDMLQFGLLKSPFYYLFLVAAFATIVLTVSFYVARKMKQQTPAAMVTRRKKSPVKLCLKCSQLLADKNGNTEMLTTTTTTAKSSPVENSESELICRGKTSHSDALLSTTVKCQVSSCPNFSSTNSTLSLSKSPADFKPFLLILNGFLFGIFGVGIPIALVCTQSGYDMFSCDATPAVDDIKTKAVKHLGMVYLVIMLSDFAYPLCCLLRLPSISASSSPSPSSWPFFSSPTRSYWTINLHLGHVTLWLILQLVEIIVYPGGFSIFTGFMIMIHRTYFYGYLVMTTASAAVSPQSLKTKWRKGLIWTQFISTLAICLHHSYFNLLAPDTCGNKTVLTSTAIYCAIISLFMGVNLASNQQRQGTQSARLS